MEYSRKSIVKGMLIAPLAGWLGALPFLINLNLSIGQFLGASIALVLLSYLMTLLLGSPGYLILKATGRADTGWLLGYAIAVVALIAIAFGDFYAILSFAPAALLITGLFCYLRKPDNAAQSQ
ncbi:MAG: hypothetical protein AAF541_16900 [Pseudomonadota bacterium]